MKFLKSDAEIRNVLNNLPVLRIDCSQHDNMCVGYAKFNYADQHLNVFRKRVAIYADAMYPTIVEAPICIADKLLPSDIREKIAYKYAPILNADDEFVLVLDDPERERMMAVTLSLACSPLGALYIKEFALATRAENAAIFKDEFIKMFSARPA